MNKKLKELMVEMNGTKNYLKHWKIMNPIEQYLNEEINFKVLTETILNSKDENLALSFYKLFGHIGIFDHLFLKTSNFYMLKFPQIFFAKTSTAIQLKENVQFKSEIFNEPIAEIFSSQIKSRMPNGAKIFINKDGNFTVRSSDFEYVTNFHGKLFQPSKEIFEKFLDK